jgi:hypothetical protein
LSPLVKEVKEGEKGSLHDFPFEIIQFVNDPECKAKLVEIHLFFRQTDVLVRSTPIAEPVYYVAFHVANISVNGDNTITCTTLDGKTLVIQAKYCNLYQKSSKETHFVVDGKIQFPVCSLKRFVNERSNGEPLPLIGVVENGEIMQVWTGGESEYNQKLGKAIADNGFVRNSHMKTVFEISKNKATTEAEAKYDRSQRARNHIDENTSEYEVSKCMRPFEVSARRTRDTDVDREMLTGFKTELTKLQHILKHMDEPEAEADAEAEEECVEEYVEDDEDDEESDEQDIKYVRKRIEWLERQIDEPPTVGKTRNFDLIIEALEAVSIKSEIREQLMQNVADSFDFWVRPKERIKITFTRERVMTAIQRVRSALFFEFKDNTIKGESALFNLILQAVDLFPVSEFQKFEEDNASDQNDDLELNNYSEAAPDEERERIAAAREERRKEREQKKADKEEFGKREKKPRGSRGKK